MNWDELDKIGLNWAQSWVKWSWIGLNQDELGCIRLNRVKLGELVRLV